MKNNDAFKFNVENETIQEAFFNQESIIGKLKRDIEKRDLKISSLEKELDECKLRAKKAEESLNPVRESLNQMTAERGRWIKKLRRAGVNV